MAHGHSAIDNLIALTALRKYKKGGEVSKSDIVKFHLAKEDYTKRGQFKGIATNLLRNDAERLKQMMIFLRKHGSPNIETGGKTAWHQMMNAGDSSVSATYNPFTKTIDTGGSGKNLMYTVDKEKRELIPHTRGEDTIIAELAHHVQGREKTEGRPRFNLQTAKTLFSHLSGGNPYERGFGGFEDEAHNVIEPRLMEEYLKTVSTSSEYPSKPLSDWQMAKEGWAEWGDMNPDYFKNLVEQRKRLKQQRLVKEEAELDRLRVSSLYTEGKAEKRSKAKWKKYHEDKFDRWIELGKPEGFWERNNK